MRHGTLPSTGQALFPPPRSGIRATSKIFFSSRNYYRCYFPLLLHFLHRCAPPAAHAFSLDNEGVKTRENQTSITDDRLEAIVHSSPDDCLKALWAAQPEHCGMLTSALCELHEYIYGGVKPGTTEPEGHPHSRLDSLIKSAVDIQLQLNV